MADETNCPSVTFVYLVWTLIRTERGGRYNLSYPSTTVDILDRDEEARAMAIRRIWHGWTTPENADEYRTLLHDEILPGIEAKEIPGYRGIELLRRDHGDEVEFITMMTFDSIQSVIDFQGEDYQRAYVPASAQKVLKRWDQVSQHYEVVETRSYA